MSAVYNDNSVPFGSKVVDIGGTSYVLESISLSRPSHIIERKNQINEPNGWVAIRGFDHGTAVLQIPTADAGYPSRGTTFSLGLELSEDDLDLWVIVDMTQPFAMSDYYKANITIRRATVAPE